MRSRRTSPWKGEREKEQNFSKKRETDKKKIKKKIASIALL